MATTVTGPKMQELLRVLKAMGFVVPAGAAPATQHEPIRTKVVGASSMLKLQRTLSVCPHCGLRGQVAKQFGIRQMGDGTIRVQSWCRDCRRDPKNERAKAYAKFLKRGGR